MKHLREKKILDEIDRLRDQFSCPSKIAKFVVIGFTTNNGNGILFYTQNKFSAHLLKKQLELLNKRNQIKVDKIIGGVDKYLEKNRDTLKKLVMYGKWRKEDYE